MRPDLWSRLAKGELSAHELGDLEARAATDPPLELSLRAYRPLSGEVRERIFDALSASLPPLREAPEAPAPQGETGAAAEAPAERASATPPAPVSKVVSLDARRRLIRAVSPLAVILSAAAIWLLVLRAPERPEVARFADLAPLPAYDLSARGGLKQTRGVEEPAGQGPLRLSPSSELDLTLRPATRVEGPLALRAFVVQHGQVRPWAAPVEIAPTGALRVHGPAGKLLAGFEGPVELRLLVGRTQALGEGTELQAKAMAPSGSGPGWQTLRYSVELVKDP